MGVRKFDHGLQARLGGRALDGDKLAMVSRIDAARAAHLALFQLQDIKSPEEQVLGVGVLFATICLRCGVDPKTLHDMGKRVLTAPAEGDTETDNSVQTLRDWVGSKIMAKETTIG